jgi:prepilin-type processing-associated H-X9-DG protein
MNRSVGLTHDGVTLWVKNMGQIKHPARRAVFIDEGWTTPDSYAVRWESAFLWFDNPPVRHNDGATVSFRDGHVEYWKWRGRRTVEFGRQFIDMFGDGMHPQTSDEWDDLRRIHEAVWGTVNSPYPLQ